MADLVVDAHQHFWHPGRYSYPWMGPETEPIARPFLPADLRPLLAEGGVDRTVLVQAQASLDEAFWFLELAEQHEFIAGVVGWVDLLDPTLPRVLDRLLLHASFKGVRHQIHDEPDEAWMIREDVLRGLGELARRGIPYDLLVRPPHLPYIPRVADRLPDLKLVVDHIAKPPIASGEIDQWARDIAAVAQVPQIYCKLSGMITEADWQGWQVEHVQPYVEVVVEHFGYDRLIFGSDWPVCTLAGSYRRVWDAAHTAIGPLSDGDHAKVFGRNACTFYALPATASPR